MCSFYFLILHHYMGLTIYRAVARIFDKFSCQKSSVIIFFLPLISFYLPDQGEPIPLKVLF